LVSVAADGIGRASTRRMAAEDAVLGGHAAAKAGVINLTET
jgi:hypothetical protein